MPTTSGGGEFWSLAWWSCWLASLACSAAPNAATLIAARLVQGVGGALVVPSSLALLNGTLTADDRARGIGIWAGISTLGTALGPYGGGWLVDHASWRYVFLLNIPLVLPALWVLRKVPDIATRRPLSVDVVGGLLAVVGLGGADLRADRGPGLRLDERAGARDRSGRARAPWSPSSRSSSADANRCCGRCCSVRACSMRSTWPR